MNESLSWLIALLVNFLGEPCVTATAAKPEGNRIVVECVEHRGSDDRIIYHVYREGRIVRGGVRYP